MNFDPRLAGPKVQKFMTSTQLDRKSFWYDQKHMSDR
jgi:hypothetical protein